MHDPVLTGDQVATVRHLTSALRSARIVLIGAAALSFHLEMRWRKTYDLDLLVLVSGTSSEFDLERELNWLRKSEQRWLSPEGVFVDVIVIKAGELSSGKKLWSDGAEMSLMGANLAFRECVNHELSPEVILPVASLPTIAFLKMVSYMERPADRAHDLADLAYILTEYLGELDDRRFDRKLIEIGLDFDQTSPYLLGMDLSRILQADEKSTVDRFVAKLLDGDDPDHSQIRMARDGPLIWGKNIDNLELSVRALQQGFQS